MSEQDATQPGPAPGAPDPLGPEIDPVAQAEADAEAAEAAVAHDLADVQALVRERDDLRELSQRLQADFENYRKRMLREQTAMVERASDRLVESLLPVLDSFEAAISQLGGESAEIDVDVDVDKVRAGVELVRNQLVDVLAKSGLAEIEAIGTAFDPNVHEAVMQEAGDGEPVVGDVVRTGYELNGRLIRPSMVKVTHTG